LKLIVGFGNPGEQYLNNRQNIGFKAVEILGNNENIDIKVKKKKSLIGRGKIDGAEVVLLKPQTFVDLIGESVLYIASFIRITVKDIICVLGDHTLPFGDLRVDYLLSNLVNPGVKSMARALKSDKFAKVRIGIGSPRKKESLEEYLYKDFTEEENLILIDVLNTTEEVIRMLVDHPIEEVQNKYNPEGAPKIKKRKIKMVRIPHTRR
jgi:peptidyl-tRNA hydrolase, PTH1 family